MCAVWAGAVLLSAPPLRIPERSKTKNAVVFFPLFSNLFLRFTQKKRKSSFFLLLYLQKSQKTKTRLSQSKKLIRLLKKGELSDSSFIFFFERARERFGGRERERVGGLAFVSCFLPLFCFEGHLLYSRRPFTTNKKISRFPMFFVFVFFSPLHTPSLLFLPSLNNSWLRRSPSR